MVRAVFELDPVERQLHDGYVELAKRDYELMRSTGNKWYEISAIAYCVMAATFTTGYSVKQVYDA